VVGRHGEDVLALLVCVAGIAPASAAFVGHRGGPLTVQDAEIELVLVGQMAHPGDEGVRK
jgi:hypothetical protein